jgi:hypothetical protein
MDKAAVLQSWVVSKLVIKTKYHGTLELTEYTEHLVKSVYRLLPMWENNEDWAKYLTGLQVELSGLNELSNNVSYISLISKLEGLFGVKEKPLFKKIVFDSISLIRKIEKIGEN